MIEKNEPSLLKGVSTLRAVGNPPAAGFWDACCDGQVVDWMESAGHNYCLVEFGVGKKHWHRVDEVFRGDLASHEANVRNNPPPPVRG